MRILVPAFCLVLAACGVGSVGGGDVVEENGTQSEEETGQLEEQGNTETSDSSSPTTSLDRTEQSLVTRTTEESSPKVTQPSSGTSPQAETDNAVDFARANLAGRLNVDMSEVVVVSVEEVTWRDGSLGCPRDDMSYTQALVNGMRIVLSVGGSDYEYHSGGTGDPFYCENPEDPLPPGAGGYGDN